MTTDELEKGLKKIDPGLYLECVVSDIDDLNEPTGVWFKAPTKIYWQLFRIDKNDFYFEPLISEIAAVNQFIGLDAVIAIGKLLYKYFDLPNSKESPKISKDSKKKNGSTILSKNITSKDSQKKTKEKLIYDFVDDVIDHGFYAEQVFHNHKIRKIQVSLIDDIFWFKCLSIQLFHLDKEVIPNNPVSLSKDLCEGIDEPHLTKISWLFKRTSKLVSDLRRKENED